MNSMPMGIRNRSEADLFARATNWPHDEHELLKVSLKSTVDRGVRTAVPYDSRV